MVLKGSGLLKNYCLYLPFLKKGPAPSDAVLDAANAVNSKIERQITVGCEVHVFGLLNNFQILALFNLRQIGF